MKHSPYISATAMTIALVVSVFSFPTEAKAQRGDSAREAFKAVPLQFGPQAAQWIAEIRGVNGIPQPTEWHVLAYDPQAPQLLRRFWSAEGRAGDNGPDLERYPNNVPVGYFSINQVVVDSLAAFTIAEGEARKARMGFDSCSYLLRVREYSSEPIWRLELIGVNRQTVGKVYISGQNGEVLRTVWVDHTNGGRIIDSSAPGNRLAPATTTPGYSSTEPTTGTRTGIQSPVVPPMSSTIPRTPTQQPITSTPPMTRSTTTTPRTTTITPIPPRQPAITSTPRPAPRTPSPIRDMREVPKKTVPPPPAPKPTAPVSKPSNPVPKPSGGRIPPPPIPPG